MGHWPRVAFGYAVDATPLPPIDDPGLARIHFSLREKLIIGPLVKKEEIVVEVAERLAADEWPNTAANPYRTAGAPQLRRDQGMDCCGVPGPAFEPDKLT